MCSIQVPKTMKMDYSQIEYATYINYDSEDSPLHIESKSEKVEARRCWTNDDFFKIFTGFKFIEGSAQSAFEKPENIVLSEKTARKIFGNQSALGKTLISDKFSKRFILLVELSASLNKATSTSDISSMIKILGIHPLNNGTFQLGKGIY